MNVPEYSVSEISGAVKRTLEGAFGRVRVRGEITEFKRYPSGHLYFSLKDEGGKIAGIVWKGGVVAAGAGAGERGRGDRDGQRHDLRRAVLVPADRRADGVCRRGRAAGADRDAAAAAGEEGLFDAERKRRLPLLPTVVGVVTSPAGAVLHDIRTTIARRFPRPVLLWPVPVQGEGAAARIAAAIAGFDAIARAARCPGRTC